MKKQDIINAIKEERAERLDKLITNIGLTLVGMIVISFIIYVFIFTFQVGEDKGYIQGYKEGRSSAFEDIITLINDGDCDLPFKIDNNVEGGNSTTFSIKCPENFFFGKTSGNIGELLKRAK